jgi:hypothetical protein
VQLVTGSAAAVLAAVGLSACYTYTPLRDPEPEMGQAFAFDVDQPCPPAIADRVGLDTRRVEGTLVRRTDTEFVVSVARTNAAGGRTYRWNGETVSLPQAYVWQVRTKHFSPTRTVAVVGGAALSFVAFVITRSLGAGGGVNGNTGVPKDNGDQQ